MKATTLTIVTGALALLGGIAALAFPLPASLAVTAFVAVFFLIGGAGGLYAGVFDADLPRRGWVLAFGLVQVVLGVWLLARPFEALVSLTLLAAIAFVIGGAGRVFYAFAFRGTGVFWLLALSGAVSAALGFYVLFNLAVAAPVLLGLLLAIELISVGVALISVGLALRKHS